MNKIFTSFLFLFFCTLGYAEEKPFVIVSVAPHKFFVERIANGSVDVILMVPAGASSHSYEPTPKQMVNAGKAQMWFLLGEPFETKAIKALKSYNSNLELVDMRQNLSLLSDHCHHGHHHHHHDHCKDPHIWLSPKMAKIQAQTIAAALIQKYPANQEMYQKNLTLFLSELDQLDKNIQMLLSPLKNRAFLVSHPAYAYFARDYDLTQLSIEFEGKDPTPKQLDSILRAAKNNRIQTIFTQYQYSNKAARLVAKELGAKIVDLDPYSEDYLNAMMKIAQSFAESGRT